MHSHLVAATAGSGNANELIIYEREQSVAPVRNSYMNFHCTTKVMPSQRSVHVGVCVCVRVAFTDCQQQSRQYSRQSAKVDIRNEQKWFEGQTRRS